MELLIITSEIFKVALGALFFAAIIGFIVVGIGNLFNSFIHGGRLKK